MSESSGFRKAKWMLSHPIPLFFLEIYVCVCGNGLGVDSSGSLCSDKNGSSLSLPLLPCRVETARFIVYFG